MLKRGQLVIMNDIDCPEAKLVAVLTRFDDKKGIWHARYLAKATSRTKCYSSGALGGPTPLADFGVRVEFSGEFFAVVPTGNPSVATYRDGKPRTWQDYRAGVLHPADAISRSKITEWAGCNSPCRP